MEEINTQSVSTILEDAMRSKNFSVEKLSQVTGVSDRFIELLLEEKINKLPAAPYLRGYLIRLGDALSIDGNMLWEIIKETRDQATIQAQKLQPVKKDNYIPTTINIKLVLGITALVIVFGFFIIRLPALLGKPKFELNEFSDGARVTTSTLVIRGTIDPADEIFINDEQIVTNEDGDFEKTVELVPEFNTFRFKVRGLLGKQIEDVKQIFYEAPKDSHKKKVRSETSTNEDTSTSTNN